MLSLDRLWPDHFVFASLVKDCARLSDARLGLQVHAQFIVSPFSHDDVVKSSLVDMYAKFGLPEKAGVVFNTIGSKTKVTWTALILVMLGVVGNVKLLKCSRDWRRKIYSLGLLWYLDWFRGEIMLMHLNFLLEMRREGVEIADPYIFSSITGAAASLAALELGKQVHCLVLAFRYDSSLFVTNALVDMYAKCSDLSAAKKIFDGMWKRDVVSWTSIIVGMAQHGRGSEALSLYDEMILAGLKPNEVTFVGLLHACSHVGLIQKGRSLFKSMVKDYGLKPSLRHYTCLLDLYSRSGHPDEAEDLLTTTRFHPEEAVWAALLSACKLHWNMKMGVWIADHLLSLGPEDP